MDYKSFTLKVQEEIGRYLPEPYQDVEASVHQVQKNNGIEYTALLLHRPGEVISPQIYLEDPFEQYQDGIPMEEILERMAESYLQSKDIEMPNVAELISDFDKAQGLLHLQLINKAYNSEKMQETPHRDLENTDLTAVLRIQMSLAQEEEASILVTDNILSNWNKTMDELYPAALENTMQKYPARIDSLMNIAMGMYTGFCSGDEIGNYKVQPYEQYVLSNCTGLNGATVLLYPDILEQLAQGANKNLFILPSSKHEIILMQDTGELNAKELQAMVMSVNRNDVPLEDWLSDEVYYYDREEHCLSTATHREETEELKNRLTETGDMELVEEERGMEER